MIIDTANRRNLNFLLLFGVFFSLDGLESKADPVFGFYNSKVSNTSNPRDIVKAKNNIYVDDFKGCIRGIKKIICLIKFNKKIT